jgi:hypothetical protein
VATWTGWQNDLLTAANLPTTAANRGFLSDWGSNEQTNCGNNPVVISRTETGSTDCKRLTATRTAQNYTSHAQASRAFAAQLSSGNFPHLRSALASGHPYSVSYSNDVIGDLVVWGAEAFAYKLTNDYSPPASGTGGGVGATAPHSTKAWKSLQQAVNHTMPVTLHKVSRYQAATSTELRRRRRVRR